MKAPFFKRATVFLSGMALSAVAGLCAAQNFPTRPVRFIAPVPPGTPTDIIIRAMATSFTERQKWTALVENKPGGNFTIAVQTTLQSPPDGHTVLMGYASFAILPSTTKDLPYVLLRDLAPL